MGDPDELHDLWGWFYAAELAATLAWIREVARASAEGLARADRWVHVGYVFAVAAVAAALAVALALAGPQPGLLAATACIALAAAALVVPYRLDGRANS